MERIFNQQRNYPFFVLLLTLLITACGQKVTVVEDNDAPYYDGIPTIRVENYVNKIYIDLLGREPLEVERDADVNLLKANSLSFDARVEIVDRLQTDTTWREGDTSYNFAYYRRLHELSKGRLLEGISDGGLKFYAGLERNGALIDSLLGDSVAMTKHLEKMQLFLDVVDARPLMRTGEITINAFFASMLRCPVYDNINMNTFNIVNASFNDLYFRYPTENEFDVAFDMIEYNQGGILLRESGQNYLDYCVIITGAREFYEGMVRWAYRSLLARDPSTEESAPLLQQYLLDGDFLKVQRAVLITDEYANF